jgi:PadR family transcriptional regulator PadR
MTRSDALQGSLPLLVLKVLARRGPLHGYAITLQIERVSDDVLRVEEGSLYPALHRMEELGWIKARWVTTAHKRRARVYDLTAAGRKQLEAEEARWREVTAAVDHVLKHA